MARFGRALAVLGFAIFAAPAPAFAQDDALATAVKATYLYKFAPFVAWPEATGAPDPDEPNTFDLCLVGDDPFGRVLDDAVAGQRVRARQIRVRRFPSIEAGGAGCDLLYVGGSRMQSAADAIEATRGSPVLTVTDEARSTKAHGVIHFVEQDGKIRFRIDDEMAAENKLTISSKLMDLAVSVRPRSRNARSE